MALGFFSLKAQYISVNTSYTSEQLVKDIFFGSQSASCILVENIQINGHTFGDGDKSFGYFNRNGSVFGMEEGIILSTGKLSNAIGPNDNIQSETDGAWLGDSDLENALGIRNTFDATILEFDFTANSTNKVSFDYLFASEQYLLSGTQSQCGYTDGFAFLIKEANTTNPYKNLAVIPGTDIPIKSNTVRGSGGLCEAINEQYFGQYNQSNSPTNFNGETKILSAVTDIVPGVKYHLKLVIADQGNGLYDSGVFLKAGSFVGNKDLGNDKLLSTGTALCEGSTLVLNATNVGSTYQWYKDGVLLVGENSATFTVSEAGFYEVTIDGSGCKLKGAIRIEYSEKPLVIEKSYCNFNENEPISINLQSLNSEIITNYQPYFDVKYYLNGTLIPDNFTYNEDVTITAEIVSGNCTIVTTLIHLNIPKKSKILEDKTICPSSTTKLEAETGFKYYKWTNENGDIINEGEFVNFIDNISIGKYFVELTSQNGCKISQEVNVFPSETPIITHIEVKGSTATVFVVGGTQPYQYSLDNLNFQSSNVFYNVPRGKHKVFVKSGDGCYTLESEFLMINLINVITPNGDGINDVLDYSDLKIKNNVSIKIYDKMGQLMFQSEGQNYIWDGKMSGRPVSTGTYWYFLNWEEPVTLQKTSYQGWVLVKNRN